MKKKVIKSTAIVRRRRRRTSIVSALPDDLIVEIVGRLAARSPAPTDDLHSVRATSWLEMVMSTRTRSRVAAAKRRRSAALAVALPDALVVDIVGLVAASSPQPMADLCNLRLTCKTMYAASKERYVGRRVALDREGAMRWREHERYLAVVKHLAGAGNPEACFIVGLNLVFAAAHHDMQEGLVCLDQAAAAGHKAAAYVLGLLLYKLHDGRDLGKHYISQVEGEPAGPAETANRECRRCRRIAADAVREVTWNKMAGPPSRVPALPEEDGYRCKSTGCGVPKGWVDYDVFCSDTCRIRHEYANFFTQVFNYLP